MNAFEEMDSGEEMEMPKLPDKIKQETLGNIYSLRLIMDIVDLFVAKAGATFHTSISPIDVDLIEGRKEDEENIE